MPTLHRNIELKARLASPAEARRAAEAVATSRLGEERQTDTYFHCTRGRLKLREREGRTAQLVWYVRPDAGEARGSDYRLTNVVDAVALRQSLSDALGVLVVVEKRREVYLYENVRIHLDEVTGLGPFVEFEAVLSPGRSDDEGRAQLAYLCGQFALGEETFVPVSYSDLLLVARSKSG